MLVAADDCSLVISSAARGVLQTMLAVYFFGDIMSQFVYLAAASSLN